MNFEPEKAELVDAPLPTKPSRPGAGLPARRRSPSCRGLESARRGQSRRDPTHDDDRGGSPPCPARRAGAAGALHGVRRVGPRRPDLPPRRRRFAPAWEDLGVELEGLVSRDDLANLKRATQYAHYTPEFMIRAIWRAFRRMGFDGGRVLEPGCGTGLFFALSPEALAGKLALTGVEMDPTTARIAKLLYPNARIRHEDFTKARLPDVLRPRDRESTVLGQDRARRRSGGRAAPLAA